MMKRAVILLLLLAAGCAKTEVLNMPEAPVIDTSAIKARPKPPKPPKPPKEEPDTARVPIGFNPSVEDWEENDIDL